MKIYDKVKSKTFLKHTHTSKYITDWDIPLPRDGTLGSIRIGGGGHHEGGTFFYRVFWGLRYRASGILKMQESERQVSKTYGFLVSFGLVCFPCPFISVIFRGINKTPSPSFFCGLECLPVWPRFTWWTTALPCPAELKLSKWQEREKGFLFVLCTVSCQ